MRSAGAVAEAGSAAFRLNRTGSAGPVGPHRGRPSSAAGPDAESALPSALACLSYLCRERNIRIDREDLREALAGRRTLDLDAAVACGRRAGLSIEAGRVSVEALRHPRTPVLMRRRDGRFVLVAAVDDDNAYLIEPGTGNARSVPGAAFVEACHDEAAFPAPPDEAAAEGFTLRSVAGHVLRHKAVLGPLVVTSFVISLLGFVYPLVFLIVIDKVVSSRGTATLDVLIGGLLFFLAFEAVLRGARHKVLRHAVRNIDRSLLSRLIRHALDLPVAFHLRNSAVETLSRVEELRHLRRFLTNAVVFVFVDILFVFVFLGLMLNFSPALALIVLASLPLYIAPALVMMPALRRKRRSTRRTRRDGNEAVLDTFNGIDTVKGMHAEHPQEGFLVRRLDDASSSEEDSEDLRASMTQYNQFVNRLAIAGLLWFGASMVLDGQLTLGQLVAINILNMRFSQPMMRLCMFVYDFSQLRAIVKEVGEILNAPTERAAGPFIRFAEFKGAIRFEDIRFRYPDSDRDALDGITLEIAAGETVGLVGSSGSGKSTLVRLVQKLHVATEGRLLLDGMDAVMFDPAWLRSHIGSVEQDYPIFRRTVAENIALGPAEHDMARVIEAARTACAHEFIAGLPKGYATRIGARGAHLSGGERQRIALARALFHAKSILVLDEATSSLDHECERMVQENVRRATEGRTAIIVAHRLSALRHVDRIVSLDRGRIVEQGTPAELALRDGYFSRMVLEEPVLADGFVTGPAGDDALAHVAAAAGSR